MFNTSLNNTGHGALVDSYYDSGTGDFYRIYADGWCEQGGLDTAKAGNRLMNLFVEMADEKYSVLATCASTNYNNVNYSTGVGTRTTTTVNISFNNLFSGNSCGSWEVRGYKKAGA